MRDVLPPAPLRRSSRALVVVLLALLGTFVAAGPASAEPDYPPQFNQISASTYAVFTGKHVVFRVQVFVPHSRVTWSSRVHGRTVAHGRSVADGAGIVVQPVRFSRVGLNVVTFSGTSRRGKPLALSARVTVRARQGGGAGAATPGPTTGSTPQAGGATSAPLTSSGDGLPVTGTQVALTLGVGLVLVIIGAVLVAAGRRRRA